MVWAIEQRGQHWFVVDVDMDKEMCPVFDTEICAAEVAIKASAGEPFFCHIPTTHLGDSYPRLGQVRALEAVLTPAGALHMVGRVG